MSECLSTVALEGYSAGTLSPEEKMAADDHLAACGRCRDQLASLGTKATPPAPPASPDTAVHPARAIFGPLLVGVVGTGFVGLVVCLHATSQLLANVEATYDRAHHQGLYPRPGPPPTCKCWRSCAAFRWSWSKPILSWPWS